MSPHPSLNAFTPGTWARAVSGVVWADYAVSEGRITAKTARGPLALLSLSGEGEDLPRLHAPTPDALEVEAHRLNLRPHFLAFVRAARGKVRASVRWKLPRRHKVRSHLAYVKACTAFTPSQWPACMKSFRLAFLRHRRIQAQHKARFSLTYRYSAAWLTDRKTGEAVTSDPKAFFRLVSAFYSQTGLNRPATLRQYAEESWNCLPDEFEEGDEFEEDSRLIESDWDTKRAYSGPSYFASEYHFTATPREGVAAWVNAFWVAPDALRGLLQGIRTPAELSLTLKALIAAAYRAHVARRVRPPARRTRVRRPLHARPRPPTCPAAPPALPAPVC